MGKTATCRVGRIAVSLLAGWGDAWIWVAFDPVYKLVPTWRVGKRTRADARQFIKTLKSKHDSHLPFFTSDDLPHYAEAILEVYGDDYTPPRQSPRGRLALTFAYYHFCCPHRGLRQKLDSPLPTKNGHGSPKKWRPVTPAMAAGLTDQVWTIDELLSFRVPPRSRWR